MMQSEEHRFQGMRRDSHPINQDSNFLWNAHNIRLTNIHDNTLISITNEKGTDLIDIPFNGNYIGHCVVGEYIIVFTVDDSSVGYIYRLYKVEEEWKHDVLYSGKDLNFSIDFPISAIADIESNLIQKVYWVDGKNQPRVINITRDKLLNREKDFARTYPSAEVFNFVPNLNLKEQVTVKTVYSGGQFPAGLIQYAFSYYNKYGQESNIFYTTELLPITNNCRGVSPEDIATCSFTITVNNLDHLFTHLRIYSIHRTSINAVPSVKIVKDLNIEEFSDSVTYLDTGLEGSSTDLFKVLYTGGETLVANAIAAKDGTLFLGNLIQNLDKIDFSIEEDQLSISEDTTDYNVELDTSTSAYYKNYITADNTSGFKTRETYRLGLQFQYNNGKWSEPIFLQDYSIKDSKPSLNVTTAGTTLKMPIIKASISINNEILENLKDKAKNVRGVIVAPDISHRTVLAQGILCPTVFKAGDRYENTPFAQSSWFTRPIVAKEGTDSPKWGYVPAYKHLEAITGKDREGEIQCANEGIPFSTINNISTDNDLYDELFVVDQSVLTFHSPDLEEYATAPYLLKNARLRIIGLTTFTSSLGDIDIQLASPGIHDSAMGFIHRQNSVSSNDTIDAGARGIISGLYYSDAFVTYSNSTFTAKDKRSFLVYPWHREGSLNNDIVRLDNSARTAVLKQKTISNLRFSEDTVWLEDSNIWTSKYGEDIALFNQDQIALAKLDSPWGGSSRINYYGNVDTLIYNNSGSYSIKCSANSIIGRTGNYFTDSISTVSSALSDSDIGGYTGLKAASDACRMKYKSTPHAVISLKYKKTNDMIDGMEILPGIKDVSLYDGGKLLPFWLTQDRNVTADEMVESKLIALQFYDADWEIGLDGKYTYRLKNKNPNIGDLLCKEDPGVTDTSIKYLWKFTAEGRFEKITFGNETTEYVNKYFYYRIGGSVLYWKFEYNGRGFVMTRITDPAIIDSITSVEGGSDKININASGISVISDTINVSTDLPFLYLAELYINTDNIYGNTDESTLSNHLWIPAGPAVPLDKNTIEIMYVHGDTWYNRYDCLKTYAFTEDDTNSIIDISSFMCESRINLQGRYDNNIGQINNLLVSPLNFNKMNPVYSQQNNAFNYRVLDSDLYLNNSLPSTVIYSLQKNPGNIIDNWTGINPASTVSVDSIYGELCSLNVVGDNLIYLQNNALGIIPFNVRTQIPTADGVPIQISNNYRVDTPITIRTGVGCQDKMAVANSPVGLFFVDYSTDSLYNYSGEGLVNISTDRGLQDWFKKAHPNTKWKPVWTEKNNGIRLCYDDKNQDLYCIAGLDDNLKSECLCYSAKIGQFVSEMSYKGASFMNVHNNTCTGLYSFYPSDVEGKTSLYEHFKGDYNVIYGNLVDSSISFISNDNPSINKIFDTLEYRADFYTKEGDLQSNKSFSSLEAFNEYQKGTNILNNRNLRKKFRVWRALVPRDGRARMRNMWTNLTLKYIPETTDDTSAFILHDLNVKYTI